MPYYLKSIDFHENGKTHNLIRIVEFPYYEQFRHLKFQETLKYTSEKRIDGRNKFKSPIGNHPVIGYENGHN